jgi:6-phosphogluconolactonase/glucosamine-6-phosphate isomerase/deaminase
MKTKIVENEEAVIQALCTEIAQIANSSVSENSVFRIGLSGRSSRSSRSNLSN